MKNENVSQAMRDWHASRPPSEKEATRLKQSDAAVAQMFTKPHQTGNPYGNPGNAGNNALGRAKRATLTRIARELIEEHGEDIFQAWLDGIRSPAPRSWPYISLLFDRTEGKAVDAKTLQEMNSSSSPRPDLSTLTREQLRDRILAIAERLSKSEPPANFIDVTPIPEPTVEELEARLADAQAKVRQAEAEVAMYERIAKLNEDPNE